MYVYQKSEPGRWVVGTYDEAGQWQRESEWNSAAEATEHIHWLNEGKYLPKKGPENPGAID